jgi:hypothetical protein
LSFNYLQRYKIIENEERRIEKYFLPLQEITQKHEENTAFIHHIGMCDRRTCRSERERPPTDVADPTYGTDDFPSGDVADAGDQQETERAGQGPVNEHHEAVKPELADALFPETGVCVRPDICLP